MSASVFNLMLKATARKVLPSGLRETMWYAVQGAGGWRRALMGAGDWETSLHLAHHYGKVWAKKPGSLLRFLRYTVRINDGRNFYYLYKDIFVKRIYHFKARRSDPFILDCGSNMGMSILYFKHIYPKARIIGFEPDPAIFPCLQENITRNGLTDVQLVQAAMADHEGTLTLHADGKYGSYLAELRSVNIPEGWTKHEIPCVRLRDYLVEPVDFLKINIEGAEWEVLADSEDLLGQVREMVVEYHHLPGLRRTLHEILALLHRHGFEYAVSDFNLDSYSGARPPVRLDANSRYCRHIYARRCDG